MTTNGNGYVGQRLRFRGPDRPFAHWSHAALIVSAEGAIVEAEAISAARVRSILRSGVHLSTVTEHLVHG